MRRVLRDNALSVFFFALFALSLCGQSVAGWVDQNEQLTSHADPAIDYGTYLVSSSFVVDVAENWQSGLSADR